ncbi:MAG: S8 family serine peptidase, partial [Xanthomonadaceae bacterium]|nr:S8 family serine peptidase [Xanthomonadaceae bacterium]
MERLDWCPNPTRGQGTVLGVIDTGVNWESVFFDLNSPGAPPVTNPRGEFFGLCDDPDVICSDKLIGVYDFTDEGTKGFDPDGHGSHVASTAVGLPLSFTLDFGTGSPISFSTSGVAPRASFISYKACEAPDPDSGPSNFQCALSTTGAALEQALVDQVDAVNFSIGGGPQNPWGFGFNQNTFLNLRAAGIVPVVAAGNDGPLDGTVGSPASLPWVLAVANASHGRVLGNSLVNTSGGPFPLGDLVGQGLTEGTTSRPIVHARDFGSALCGFGPAELGPNCEDNTGASSPFAPGTFNGEIVVCDRGTYGRVEKGRNLLEAGAGGMILANTEQDGEATSSDQHCLPASHVGSTAGDRLRLWLASGSNHQGRLSGADRFIDPAQQGLI